MKKKKRIKGKLNISFELELPRELRFLKFSFEKIWSETKEHLPFTLWIFKRILVPLIPFLILANFVFKIEILPVILVTIVPFVYGSFLPDFDSLMKYSKEKNSSIFNKLFLLFFGPIYIYYFVFEKSRPIYTNRKKEFHSLKYFVSYFFFLFIISFLIFSSNDLYKHLIFSFLGSLGFLVHLLIDKKIVI